MWLGSERGYLQDWITQLWVKATGRRIDPAQSSWLMGPIGKTDVISDTFIEELCKKDDLHVFKNLPDSGLMDDAMAFGFSESEQARLHPVITDFYERTINYEFEVWSQWCGFFYPFGKLLNILFSKRLQQLNLPLSSLDSSKGIESNIIKLAKAEDKKKSYWTIWYRILNTKKEVIYSGVYSTTKIPQGEQCMKVVFPLPNGNATVVMRKEVMQDGSLMLISDGEKFGDPGFYFLLTNGKGKHWAKYVKVMHETIHVYVDEKGVLRTDHHLKIYGLYFLKLHYKMTKKQKPVN